MPLRPLGVLLLFGWVILLPAAAQEKPSPASKARRLLDDSVETLSSASAAVQLAAILQIIDLYRDHDASRTIELIDQGMMIAGAVPPYSNGNPGDPATRVVTAAAAANLEKAIELLPSLPVERRSSPVNRIVRRLIEEKNLDRAVEVLDLHSAGGFYPFDAASALLKALPADDPRRVAIFTSATTTIDPKWVNQTVTPLLAEHWRTLPRPLVEAAATRAANAILDRDDGESTQVTSLSSPRGSVSFDERKDYELFDLVAILKEFDPDRVRELREKRPQLDAALKQFPAGTVSMRASPSEGISTSTSSRGKGQSRDPQSDARMKIMAQSDAQAQKALALANTDLSGAVGLMKEISDPYLRTRTLLAAANRAAEKEPAAARSILSQVETYLSDNKDPYETAPAWGSFAEAAAKARENELASKAIDKGIAACQEIYKKDTFADNPNLGPREQWPSLQHYRALMYRAVALYGVDADTLLPRVTDPDLTLMGRIEIARALLGKPRGGTSISINHGKPR